MEKQKNEQLVETARFYGDMRFKQFTLFLAWLSIVGAGIVYGGEYVILCEIKLKLLLALASIIMTGIFWIMEISSSIYWVANREACKDVWKLPSPKSKFIKTINKIISTTNAMLILFIINYILWIVCAYNWGLNRVVFIVLIFIGLLIFLYSILNYIPLWRYKDN